MSSSTGLRIRLSGLVSRLVNSLTYCLPLGRPATKKRRARIIGAPASSFFRPVVPTLALHARLIIRGDAGGTLLPGTDFPADDLNGLLCRCTGILAPDIVSIVEDAGRQRLMRYVMDLGHSASSFLLSGLFLSQSRCLTIRRSVGIHFRSVNTLKSV